jgi:flagellar hook assembly protein FlgD
VVIKIHGVLGREICTLINNHLDAGMHILRWDGTDNLGNELASGLYIISMQAGNYKGFKKMHLIK